MLLNIREATSRIQAAGIDISVGTLRRWTYTWPDGDRKGPPPILVSPRKLRFKDEHVDDFIRETLAGVGRGAYPDGMDTATG